MTVTTATLSSGTRRLVLCGTVAGLLFPIASLVQAFTRTGFDLRRHALSWLTLGDLGWLQPANFVLSGLLATAGAAGVRQAVRTGRASTFGPLLIGVYGVGMVGGGLVRPDPRSASRPARLSTSGTMQTVFVVAAFMSLIAAGPAFAHKFAGQGRRAWAAYSAATGVVTFVITTLPWGQAGESPRHAVGAVLISGWLVAVSSQLRSGNIT